jgi:uncharacterized damage-inducible protein DinB
MTDTILGKLFEHNNWANLRIIQACSALSEDQLDTDPQSATKGSIRVTLTHLVTSQQNYLSLLTLPVDARLDSPPAFADLPKAASMSGEALLALARDGASKPLKTQLRTKDGYFVDPWVVMLQAINHATEHREQISSMLTAVGVTPPDLDGWAYGEAAGALVPISR